MPKNIVLCCDGTGNKFVTDVTNVIRLFNVLDFDDSNRQIGYYHPGLGTLASPAALSRVGQTDGDGIWLWYFQRYWRSLQVSYAIFRNRRSDLPFRVQPWCLHCSRAGGYASPARTAEARQRRPGLACRGSVEADRYQTGLRACQKVQGHVPTRV